LEVKKWYAPPKSHVKNGGFTSPLGYQMVPLTVAKVVRPDQIDISKDYMTNVRGKD